MSGTKTLRVACEGTALLALDALSDLQGDLKELTEANEQKLRKSFKRFGFSAPFFVWKSSKDGKTYVLDGTQRRRVLTKMRNEGWTIPELPVATVEAKDIGEARQKLLRITSQYGQVTNGGFEGFVLQSGLSFKELSMELRLPELTFDFAKIEEDYSDLDAEEKKLRGFSDESIVIEVPKKYHERVVEWLANGQAKTGPGMGKGVMKRCGLR